MLEGPLESPIVIIPLFSSFCEPRILTPHLFEKCTSDESWANFGAT
jgi:hypothetical protein